MEWKLSRWEDHWVWYEWTLNAIMYFYPQRTEAAGDLAEKVEDWMIMGAERHLKVLGCWFKRWRRGSEAKKYLSQIWKKPGNGFSTRGSRQRVALLTFWPGSSETAFQLLACKTVRESSVLSKPLSQWQLVTASIEKITLLKSIPCLHCAYTDTAKCGEGQSHGYVLEWAFNSALKSYHPNLACSYSSIILGDISYLLSPQLSSASNLLSAEELFYWKQNQKNQNQLETKLKTFSKLPSPFCVSDHSPGFPLTINELFIHTHPKLRPTHSFSCQMSSFLPIFPLLY